MGPEGDCLVAGAGSQEADATAAAIDPDPGDGYQAAVINFNFIASEVWTTKEAVEELETL